MNIAVMQSYLKSVNPLHDNLKKSPSNSWEIDSGSSEEVSSESQKDITPSVEEYVIPKTYLPKLSTEEHVDIFNNLAQQKYKETPESEIVYHKFGRDNTSHKC